MVTIAGENEDGVLKVDARTPESRDHLPGFNDVIGLDLDGSLLQVFVNRKSPSQIKLTKFPATLGPRFPLLLGESVRFIRTSLAHSCYFRISDGPASAPNP